MTADRTRTEFMMLPLLAGTLLGIAGFAGNWFRYTLFLNIDFLFGGFFVMTALLRYGTRAGIVASLIASSCTWLMWNHPYAIIIFTAETAIVGILNSKRNKADLLLHDIGYWLICGAPLVWIFYHLVLGDTVPSTSLIIGKQALNGVINSLLASIFHLVAMSRRKEAERPSLQQTVFILMVSLVLFSACFHVFRELRTMKGREDLRLAEQTERAATMTRAFMASWLEEHHRVVISLAERIGDPDRKSFAEIQLAVETLKGGATAFSSMGVMDRNATTVAFAPLTDELGGSTLGVSFADRPYLATIKEQRKPYVSAVLTGKFGKRIPVVPLIAPMSSGGRFTGFCSGAVRVEELTQYLKTIIGGRNMDITVLDQSGQVVASSRGDLAVMTPYAPRKSGSLRRVTADVDHWIPDAAKGKNLSQRWAASLYLAKAAISPDSQWTVVVENAYGPVLAVLQRYASSWLFQLLLMAVIVIPLSSFISFRLTRSLRTLQKATISLPDDVKQDIIPELPGSNIQDIDGLMTNFRSAALALQAQHQALKRSEEMIRRGKDEWERTFDSVPDLIAILDDQHRILRLNQAMAERLGRSPEECIGLTCYEAIHCADCPPRFCPHVMTIKDGQVHETDLDSEMFGGDFLVTTSPLHNQQGEIYATVHMARDISAVKQARKKAEESAAELESIFSAIQDAILIYDTEMNVTKVNRMFVSTYGFDPVGLNLGEMVARTNCRRLDGRPFVLDQQPTPLALQGETVLNQRFLVSRYDGTEIALETSSTPLRLDGSRISGVVTVWHDITDTLRDQKELHEKEERYRTLVEHAPFAIFINRDNRIEYANPATLELFGAGSTADLVGKSPYDFFHPEYHPLMTERINRLLSGGSVPLIEARVVQLDGTLRFVEIVASAFVDRYGVAIQVMLHDISRRKENEKEIQAILERLSLAQKSAGAGLWDWDIRAHTIAWSPELFSLFGLNSTGGEANLELWRTIMHPEDWLLAEQRMTSALEKRERLFNEFRIVLPSGEIRWISAIGDTLCDDDGKPLRMTGICLDITLRKQAEERLNLLADIAETLLVTTSPQGAVQTLCTKALAVLDCQLFFNFIVDRDAGRLHLNACSGISTEVRERIEWLDYGVAVCGCVARDASRIVAENIPESCDPRTELVRSFGVKAYACHPLMMGEEVLGTLSFGSSTRASFNSDDLALMQAVTNLVSIAMERELARERLQKAHDALELQVAERTKDLVRTIDSLHDEMSERLKAEEELRARERLLIQQSRLAAMGEMISNIAHQWRQPLNTLGLIVQRLPHFYDAGRFDREFLITSTRDAMNLVRHMSATIDDFRDFFRPDRERTIFNVKKAVNQAISLVDTGFKALNIDFETRIEGEPTISGYPSQFSQVLLNILFNARDALIERAVNRGRIRIEVGREGDRLVLAIRDNAGGIPDDILDKVFDPYFTTKGPDRGTGIGLFMAKSIIEKSMGGRITACNHEDGAEFRIEV